MALTQTGYTPKRLYELKQEYDRLLTESLGPINTEPDSVIGQLEGIWAEALANLYEQMQDTYHSMYPSSAEGVSLDGAVSYVGITRLAAYPTQVVAAAYGRESTLLQQDALVSDRVTQYRSTADTVISRANAIDTTIEIEVSNLTTYSLNINGALISFMSTAKATAEQIINGLGNQLTPKQFSFSNQRNCLQIFATNGITPFAISVGDKLKITRIGSPVRFIAESTGRKVLPVGALNQIITPRSGWDSIGNLVAGTVGRERETDTELRQRFEQSRQVLGSATVKAIRARLLQEVPGINEVRIFENRLNVTSQDDIPPHALEALVVGGEDQAIADTLWNHKPAGIETYGTTEVLVQDENRDGQLIRFSRPTQHYAWVKVHVGELYNEEALPSDVLTGIKLAVVQHGQSLGIGEDIILQRFLGPIYANTSGLGQLTIAVAIMNSENELPVYQTKNIPLDRRTIALFASSRVEVSGL